MSPEREKQLENEYVDRALEAAEAAGRDAYLALIIAKGDIEQGLHLKPTPEPAKSTKLKKSS